jgi:hypothetical protein
MGIFDLRLTFDESSFRVAMSINPPLGMSGIKGMDDISSSSTWLESIAGFKGIALGTPTDVEVDVFVPEEQDK